MIRDCILATSVDRELSVEVMEPGRASLLSRHKRFLSLYRREVLVENKDAGSVGNPAYLSFKAYNYESRGCRCLDFVQKARNSKA